MMMTSPSNSSTGTSNGRIRVVAPATLAEGYTFDVMLEGEAFTVQVPKGGVEQGETFEIPYPEATPIPVVPTLSSSSYSSHASSSNAYAIERRNKNSNDNRLSTATDESK
jgi:hypothetical protein